MKKIALTALLLASLSAPASAGISAGPSIGSYQTFTDSNTGRNCIRLDSFFNKTYNDMAGLAVDAGFTLARKSDVRQLLNSLPDVGTEWSNYAAVMGSGPNRALIWAAYGPVINNNVGYAFAYDGDSSWNIYDDVQAVDTVPNGGRPDADLNIFAYSGGTVQTPEPAGWAITLLGAGAMALLRRRKQA